MTATTDLTPWDLAKARYDEARRVEDAYSSVVVKHRGKWRTAPPGPLADRARRALAMATAQLTKATMDKQTAWRAWHALGGPSRHAR